VILGELVAYFLEVPLGNGENVLAEVTAQVDDVVPFATGKNVVGKLAGSLGEGLEGVRTFAGEVLASIKNSPQPPDRVAVEFGVTLSAQAGVAIAEVAGEGHLTITLEWSRPAGPVIDEAPVPTVNEPPAPDGSGQ
jgi:hypothetical protein